MSQRERYWGGEGGVNIHFKRAMAADSIGVWLNIFSIMNYAATFMNCLVIGTTNVG